MMKMKTATITTKFDNRAFVPGEKISGTVSWQSQESLESAGLRLFYYTEGKGTQDVKIVDELSLSNVASSESREYAFDLPNGPFSFSGKLVSVRWALELVLEPGGHAERLEIVLSPTGAEIDLYANEHAQAPGDAVKRWKNRFKVTKG